MTLLIAMQRSSSGMDKRQSICAPSIAPLTLGHMPSLKQQELQITCTHMCEIATLREGFEITSKS